MLRHDGVETPGESIQNESLTILAMAAQKQIHAGIDGVDGRGSAETLRALFLRVRANYFDAVSIRR